MESYADTDLTERLRTGAHSLGVELNTAQCEQMLSYLELLSRWNQAMDLTAIDTIDEAIPWHLLDSLAGAPYIGGQRWLDVGSGAGLPGVPLAIAFPQRQLVLIDSRRKRSQFLTHVVSELGLTNVEVINQRVEAYRPEAKFDTLLARAFAAIPELIDSICHLRSPHTRLLVWKGVRPEKDMDVLRQRPEIDAKIYPADIPGLAASRHLVLITFNA